MWPFKSRCHSPPCQRSLGTGRSGRDWLRAIVYFLAMDLGGDGAVGVDEEAEVRAELAAMQVDMASGAAKPRCLSPWLEKYRPSRLDEIVHQPEVVRTLRRTLELKSLPHLLFYGPPGTGKTTCALAIAKQLYGGDPAIIRQNVLELNASTERGIDVIRAKVKAFSRFKPKNIAKVKGGLKGGVEGGVEVGFKVVILDEADAMTRDAQGALRRLMETSVAVTRFIVLCNYVTRIIEPIVSRCASFRFQPIPPDAIIPRLRQIAQTEAKQDSKKQDQTIMGQPLEGVLGQIAGNADGDMRRAISALYQVHTLGLAAQVDETMGCVPAAFASGVLATIANQISPTNQKSSNNPKSISNPKSPSVDSEARDGKIGVVMWAGDVAAEVVGSGYCLRSVFERLAELVVEWPGLSERQRAIIAMQLAQADERIQAADPRIQLTHLFLSIATVVRPDMNGMEGKGGR